MHSEARRGPFIQNPAEPKTCALLLVFSPCQGGCPAHRRQGASRAKKKPGQKYWRHCTPGRLFSGQRVLTPAPSRAVDSTPGKERRRPAPGGRNAGCAEYRSAFVCNFITHAAAPIWYNVPTWRAQVICAPASARLHHTSTEVFMSYLVTFLEGVITFISPCLLPMLPIYLSYFAAGTQGPGSTRATAKNALGFILGFTVTFLLLGTLAGSVGMLLYRWQFAVNLICGCLLYTSPSPRDRG